MPSRTAFESQAEYYSTLFHELTHSTGHAKRLAREGFDRPQMFGSESYSREELIAEMGSAMLCGVAGIEQATVANSSLPQVVDCQTQERFAASCTRSECRAKGRRLHPGGVPKDSPPPVVGTAP